MFSGTLKNFLLNKTQDQLELKKKSIDLNENNNKIEENINENIDIDEKEIKKTKHLSTSFQQKKYNITENIHDNNTRGITTLILELDEEKKNNKILEDWKENYWKEKESFSLKLKETLLSIEKEKQKNIELNKEFYDMKEKLEKIMVEIEEWKKYDTNNNQNNNISLNKNNILNNEQNNKKNVITESSIKYVKFFYIV